MKLDFAINTNELPESEDYGPIPAGEYQAVVRSCEAKTTRTGTGQYLNIGFTVEGPSHEGRVVFSKLNIRNANPKAEEIGRRELGDLLRAIGLASLTDTDQLIGGPCVISVRVDKSEQYGDSNEVKRISARKGGIPQAAQPAAQAAQPPQAAPPAKKAPWA